jgi:hypothetical protein
MARRAHVNVELTVGDDEQRAASSMSRAVLVNGELA